MKIDSYSFTLIGGREENQDALGKTEDGENAFFVVADGLGGHRLGSLASSCAVSSLLENWKATEAYTPEHLTELVEKANVEILALQKEHDCAAKSTVVLLSIQGKKAMWANTGDSRLYYIHDGELAEVTEDHSVAFKKYKAGEITRSEIATDEDQSALLRTLGVPTRWKPDISNREELTAGDAFFLCTDGMWEYVSDDEILVDCLKAENAQDWAEHLLVRAASRISGNNDNLSLITVMIR